MEALRFLSAGRRRLQRGLGLWARIVEREIERGPMNTAEHWRVTGIKTLALWVLIVACVVGAGMLAGGALGADPKEKKPGASGLKIVVVDLREVLRKSEEWKDYAGERKLLVDRMDRTISKLERQLQILSGECKNLAPGTKELKQKQIELEKQMRQYRTKRGELQREILAQQSAALRAMFLKIMVAIEEYASSNRVDLVLKKHRFPLSSEALAQMKLPIEEADILYAAPSLDVTGEIARALNAEYPREIEEE